MNHPSSPKDHEDLDTVEWMDRFPGTWPQYKAMFVAESGLKPAETGPAKREAPSAKIGMKAAMSANADKVLFGIKDLYN